MRLSAEQRAAASRLEGAVRVVAGPGTGKTAVITERFRRLVASGVPPESVLVMTFSERAASEMRSRITAAIGAEPPQVGTFHSLAMRWLREDGRAVGVHPAFRIETGADRWIALRELMWELAAPALIGEERPDVLVSPLLKVLERLKQELIPLDRLEAWCRTAADRERADLLAAAAALFQEHERRKRKRLVLDFDDLLVGAVRLLAEHPPLLERYRARFPHVMVDEYQDTNLAQERLVELLGGGGSTFVVGDDDQSIYRFRGASLASMERFAAAFAGAETVQLGRNRRSTAAIVGAATALIGNNTDRIPKELAAAAGRGPDVVVLECGDGEAESSAITREVACAVAAGTPLGEVAVLCRTNAVARVVVDALEADGIPVRHWGAQGLFALPGVRDVIAMLRVLAGPDDMLPLARLLDRMGGGVEAGVARLAAAAGDRPALSALASWAPAAGWAPALEGLRPEVAVLGVSDLFFELMARTRYLERPEVVRDARSAAAVTRFGELISEFCERFSDQSLGAFLDRLDLVLLSGEEEELPAAEELGEAVQVMTIHQAKGLEFDVVFVPGLVEGRMPQPHRREGLDLPQAVLEPAVRGREDHVAEERRLAYVAMTRARRRLYLSWALRYEGTREWRRSRFLSEAEAAGRVTRREVAANPETEADAPGRRRRHRRSEPLTLSFSAIAAYRECPRQHWFRYRVGLAPTETVEGQYGTVMHAVLMRAGAERRRGEPVDLARLESLLTEEWDRVRFADPRRAPTLRRLAGRQLAGFLAAGGLAPAPELVERSFTADLDSWRLRGIIDRVDRHPPPTLEGGEAGSTSPNGEGAWRLVDYKTGSPLPASRLRRDLQLALYALGARLALGLGADGTPVELEIVYLKDGRRVVLPATEELVEEARRTGAEVAEAIGEGRFEPRPERRRCGLCAYRLACSAAL